LPEWLEERFRSNPFLKGMLSYAKAFLGTQGDGNHFFYVGMRESTGETVLMTHHGSRKPGALLYKQGTKVAEAHTKQVSPEVGQHNSWIDPESQEHKDYWDALQIIRLWTRENHFQIHDAVLNALDLPVPDYGVDRFWNEHNFVFERDGLYYHAKGATPAYSGFSEDDTGLTLIPLNMAEPVLITRGLDNPSGLGFAPHGAGRNMGRKAYVRNVIGDQDRGEVFARETAGIDARFLGEPDLSELPGAYKNADQVRAQIDRFGLAEVTDLIQPYGSIMAGEMEMPWQRKRREKMKENPQ